MSDYSFCYMLKARDLSVVYVSESVADVLGFEPRDLINRSTIDILFHPDEKEAAAGTLNATASNHKVSCLVYLQLFHRTGRFVDCVMAQSAVNNVIVGSISLADATGAARRNDTAEEVIIITEPISHAVWVAPPQPRAAFLLDRFSNDCTITHCTNNAILDSETCVNHPGGIFRYVARRDEQRVRTFIANLKRPGIGAGNGGFFYIDFHMCIDGRESRASPEAEAPRSDEVEVSAIGSATSDALILIVRRIQ